MLVPLVFASLLSLAAADPWAEVPPVPAGARDGEIVEVDGALYEVVGAALWPLDEGGQRVPPPGTKRKSAATPAAVAPALGQVSVTGSRLDKDPGRSVVKTQAITATEIAERGATTLADVLDDEAGINLQSAFGLGQNVSIDGLDGNHVLILVDGRPVNGRVDNKVDVSRIPVSASSIERVEVVRGPMSALYGSDALGGVVNIITKRPAAGVTGELDLSTIDVGGGVFWNTISLHGSASGGPAAVRFDVQGTSAPAIDQGGYDAVEQEVLFRPDGKNDTPDRRGWQAMGEVDIFVTNDWVLKAQGAVDLSETSARIDPQVPFRQHAQNAEAQVSASAEGDVAPGHQLSFDARVDRFTHRFENNPNAGDDDPAPFCQHPDRLSFGLLDPACPGVPVPKTRAVQDEARFEGRYTGTFVEDVFLVEELAGTTGAVVAKEHVERVNEDGDDTIPGGGDRTTGALYAELLWRPVEWLALLPGGRVDLFAPGAAAEPFGFAVGPKISARLDLPLGFALRSSYGQGFRLPSFQERFLRFDHSELGYVVDGNPDLRPETSHGFRGEALWTYAFAEVSVEGFANLVDNLITEDAAGTNDEGIPIFTYENFAHATTAGVNAEVSLKRVFGFSLDVQYQWLPFAVDASACPDGNPWFCGEDEGAVRLSLRPAHELYTKLRYDVHSTQTSVFTYAALTSERPIDRVGGVAPGSIVLGVGLRQQLLEHAELTVTLDDLTNAYHPVYGPKPGRHATATLRAWF